MGAGRSHHLERTWLNGGQNHHQYHKSESEEHSKSLGQRCGRHTITALFGDCVIKVGGDGGTWMIALQFRKIKGHPIFDLQGGQTGHHENNNVGLELLI